jgi:hypothetical protein
VSVDGQGGTCECVRVCLWWTRRCEWSCKCERAYIYVNVRVPERTNECARGVGFAPTHDFGSYSLCFSSEEGWMSLSSPEVVSRLGAPGSVVQGAWVFRVDSVASRCGWECHYHPGNWAQTWNWRTQTLLIYPSKTGSSVCLMLTCSPTEKVPAVGSCLWVCQLHPTEVAAMNPVGPGLSLANVRC